MAELVPVAVVVDAPQHSTVRGPLSYLGDPLWPAGTLVQVPLGSRTVCGVLWPTAVSQPEPDLQLRAVSHALGSLPPLPAAWCELVRFAAGYYQRSVGEVALAVLPPELRKLSDKQ